ncbi:vicianin hydrolase-like [Prosopis cineraria]|uniref:vicianin hydrolase-like n=1 Tax=Prosopis cineraria TaxID=364024 RepID=UPI00240EC804|nr:vicianin hydrolase-like [Prosopis cineraria]
MKKIGLDSFRFSISWSRIFPEGGVKVNRLGVEFYNNVINELLANGIIPFVTLFHWDVPQALTNKYGGFLDKKVVDDFRRHANFCFKTFGDRVKNWATLNEPHMFSFGGYDSGTFAPGRCSNYVGNCTAGNSSTEPYTVAHNLLLAHAAAVGLYRTRYQVSQRGQIGITLDSCRMIPKYETPANREAANRALDFYFGWFAHPVTYGDYPESMRSIVGDRLPKFKKAESKMLKGSYDFLGVNYYTANYVENNPSTSTANKSYTSDIHVTFSTSRDGVYVGAPTALKWLYVYPEGLRELLVYVKNEYQNPTIYITENGVAEANDASIPVHGATKDGVRIIYIYSHLRCLLQAIWGDGVNVKGYYMWAFMDDFEWNSGYTPRFGLTFVDYKDNLKRYLKFSAHWFKRFLNPWLLTLPSDSKSSD